MGNMKVYLLLLAALVWTSLVSTTLAFTTAQYSSALDKSILFYDLQRSGKLPNWQRLRWRGNSGLNDGRSNGVCVQFPSHIVFVCNQSTRICQFGKLKI